jgi:DNA-binding GntR family transcriptional regulator
MIIDRALPTGSRIVPEQLARQMGVSRTPVLSALNRLFQERLVDWYTRRGVFVRQLPKAELAQIFEMREVMEGLAARRAAKAATDDELRELEAMFAGWSREETAENRARYLKQDYFFHFRILELAASPPLTAGLESLNIMAAAFTGGLIRSVAEGLREHATILQALRKRDANAAEAAMRLHLRRSVEKLSEDARTEAGSTDVRNASGDTTNELLRRSGAPPRRRASALSPKRASGK